MSNESDDLAASTDGSDSRPCAQISDFAFPLPSNLYGVLVDAEHLLLLASPARVKSKSEMSVPALPASVSSSSSLPPIASSSGSSNELPPYSGNINSNPTPLNSTDGVNAKSALTSSEDEAKRSSSGAMPPPRPRSPLPYLLDCSFANIYIFTENLLLKFHQERKVTLRAAALCPRLSSAFPRQWFPRDPKRTLRRS